MTIATFPDPSAFPYLTAEAHSRVSALAHRRIICRDECDDTWTTTLGEWATDNADCLGDDDVMPLITDGTAASFSQCGPFEIRWEE